MLELGTIDADRSALQCYDLLSGFCQQKHYVDSDFLYQSSLCCCYRALRLFFSHKASMFTPPSVLRVCEGSQHL